MRMSRGRWFVRDGRRKTFRWAPRCWWRGFRCVSAFCERKGLWDGFACALRLMCSGCWISWSNLIILPISPVRSEDILEDMIYVSGRGLVFNYILTLSSNRATRDTFTRTKLITEKWKLSHMIKRNNKLTHSPWWKRVTQLERKK